MGDSDCQWQIQTNADVSGIGIRANLYTTVLLMALIPHIPERTSPLVEVLTENVGISGLALLITAIYQTHQGRLSLYHAIFIIHILYFTGILVAPAGHYKHDTIKRRVVVSGLITYGCYLMFTAYALYVWAKGTAFSGASSLICASFNNSEPSDEQIKKIDEQIEYILFFRPVLVHETWLRVLWMAGLGVSLALLIILPILGCIHFFKQGIIRQGPSSHVKKPLFSRVLWVGKILAAVYGVATLELYEKTNLHNGVLVGPEDDWSFGQVFAFLQLVATINEAVHCFISAPSRSAVHSDHEDRESAASAHGRNSTASSRIINVVFEPGLLRGENKNRGTALDKEETHNLDEKSPISAVSTIERVQPLVHGQTHGAMVIV